MLHVCSNAAPCFQAPFCSVHHKGSHWAEFDRLETEGILETVPPSKWAAPIVAVPKKDGTFQICRDCKVTVNQDLDVYQYPLPKPEELLTSLPEGQQFSKLDLRSPTSRSCWMKIPRSTQPSISTNVCINIRTCLPFGIVSAPALFQKTMDTILKGMPHVICYLYDILVTGADNAKHLCNLEEL